MIPYNVLYSPYTIGLFQKNIKKTINKINKETISIILSATIVPNKYDWDICVLFDILETLSKSPNLNGNILLPK